MNPGSETIPSIGLLPVLVLLLLAGGCALFLARLYREVSQQPSGSDLRTAFPLVAIALTALFLTVQLSLPLSIGLLAALTVLRFRAPIKEPEEIAFVMALVSISATLATLRLVMTGVLLGAAVLAVLATKALRARHGAVQGLLVVSLPAGRLEKAAIPGLHERGCCLQSITVAGSETVLSFRFATDSESQIHDVERDMTRTLPLARARVLLDSPDALR